VTTKKRGEAVRFTPRWVVVVLIVVVVVGLLAFARGREHRRGDEVGQGSIGATVLMLGS
jgi:hypothetical protein